MKYAIFFLLMSFSLMAEEQQVCSKIKSFEAKFEEVKVKIEDRVLYAHKNGQNLVQTLIAARISNSKVCAKFYDPNGSSDGKFYINSLKL